MTWMNIRQCVMSNAVIQVCFKSSAWMSCIQYMLAHTITFFTSTRSLTSARKSWPVLVEEAWGKGRNLNFAYCTSCSKLRNRSENSESVLFHWNTTDEHMAQAVWWERRQNGTFGCSDGRPAASWTWFHLIHVTADICSNSFTAHWCILEYEGEHRREGDWTGKIVRNITWTLACELISA